MSACRIALLGTVLHALIKNMDSASRASNNTELQKNADGSLDIFFGPKAPEGKATNWVPTDPKREFEAMFRSTRRPRRCLKRRGCCPPSKDFSRGEESSSHVYDAANLLSTLVIFVLCGPKVFAADTLPVAVDNFVRAESDHYLDGAAKKFGFGKFGFESSGRPALRSAFTYLSLSSFVLYVIGSPEAR